jgi:hypothetical protein
MRDALNDSFSAACALYAAAVTVNDAALVLRTTAAPTTAVELANSLSTSMAVSTARGALYEVLIAEGWTPPPHATAGMARDQQLLNEGTGAIEA